MTAARRGRGYRHKLPLEAALWYAPKRLTCQSLDFTAKSGGRCGFVVMRDLTHCTFPDCRCRLIAASQLLLELA
jgi:hypothetical protein